MGSAYETTVGAKRTVGVSPQHGAARRLFRVRRPSGIPGVKGVRLRVQTATKAAF